MCSFKMLTCVQYITVHSVHIQYTHSLYVYGHVVLSQVEHEDRTCQLATSLSLKEAGIHYLSKRQFYTLRLTDDSLDVQTP